MTIADPIAAARCPQALLRAYRQTQYHAGGVTVRIGRRAPPLDRVLHRAGARAAVLVTAWNPMSRRMPPGWNQRMQRRLEDHLRRMPHLPAHGRWRLWQEAHVLVLAEPVRVLPLARRFRQRAVVVVRVSQPARLAWL